MTCPACGEHPKINTARDFTKAVIEINNGPEAITLLRKVVIPASMGDDTDVPAAIGKYNNVILYYEANKHVYIYSSDGIPTLLEAEVSAEVMNKINTLEVNLAKETKDRKDEDDILDGRLTTVEGIAATAVQPSDINRVVMTDASLDTAVTSTVQIKEDKVNLSTGSTSTGNIVLPVASNNQAGVMNSATYNAVSANSNNIASILGGAVAITGLSASPSQSDLTSAWQSETGLTTLINRASIYDVTNSKVWTYYTNDTTWYAASNSTQVTVNPFTNSSAGIILGSTNTGQVFAENDGTGSVNGWDSLVNTVSGKQDALTAGTNISISDNTISATDTTYTAGTGLSLAGTTFSVDTSVIAQKSEVPVITMTDTDPGEGSALAANNFIGVYGEAPIIMDYSTSEVDTGAKWIDGTAIYKKTVYLGNLPNATTKNVAHGVTNFGVPIKLEGMALTEAGNGHPINISRPTNLALEIGAYVDATNIVVMTGNDRSSWTGYATIYYTKSS